MAGVGGKLPGVPNKRTQQLQLYVDREGNGVSPAKVLLAAMWHHYQLAAKAMKVEGEARDDRVIARHLEAASKIAEKAAPYVHAKLSTVVVQGDEDGGPVTLHHSAVPTLTREQLAGMSDHDIARQFAATVGAALPDTEESEGSGAAGNGAMPEG